MKKIVILSIILVLSTLSVCAVKSEENVQIQIFVTSDVHGKFLPYDYTTFTPSNTGSLAQVATAIKQYRTDNTLVLDAGDIIQGNNADIFINDSTHPMSEAMNQIGYDYWVTGNHEYNYGMDALKSFIEKVNARLLLANVRDKDNNLLGKPYEITELGGVRIALIGIVSPNITIWDKTNLACCTVLDPVEETKKIIKEVKDKADVIIAVSHMMLENEYKVKNSGVRDLANACPELSLIIAAHGHTAIENLTINGVPIIENTNEAKTLCRILIDVHKKNDSWKVTNIKPSLIYMENYKSEAQLEENLHFFHKKAMKEEEVVIGFLNTDSLVEPNEIVNIPSALSKDSALMDFINDVQLHYSKANISAANLSSLKSNMKKGNITAKDINSIYVYNNTMYKLRMNGKQLKKWMEWSASIYNTFKEGDLTISFKEGIPFYLCDFFCGINYEINISKDSGNRIEKLTWPDGRSVKDEDVFTVCVTNYRATTALTQYGYIFNEGEELPVIIEENLCNGSPVKTLIKDYIKNVKNGVIAPKSDNNWKLTGINYNPQLKNRALKLVNEGKIKIQNINNGKAINTKSITEKDVILAEQ